MNLIYDPWIQVIDADNAISLISPSQISHPPIKDIVTVRPDFKGALYQLLIGLLQTAAAPRNDQEWFAMWETPPSSNELAKKFSAVAPAFEFSEASPSFMQDFDMPNGETKPIGALLIEAPGGKTLKDNLDHFIKRGNVEGICHGCAAMALYTLQINAPSGGVGHRTGLRGGGPLTTLVMPDETSRDSLWHRLWLNVLPEKIFRRQLLADYNWEAASPGAIFPWLGPTRTSEKKDGKTTFPKDVSPYHMYWAMPRRIRLIFDEAVAGTCDLCGTTEQKLVHYFVTKNYGYNYEGPWEHPLTPYSRRQQTDMPLPLHGQKGGVTYRHWLGLTIGQADTQLPAKTVSHYIDKQIERVSSSNHARLWSFGFDMDNMKARCWYDAIMPLYSMQPAIVEAVKELATDFIAAAEEACANLRQEVKKAWFKRPQDKKGDWAFVDRSFWPATEAHFYKSIKTAITALERDQPIADLRMQWHTHLRRTAMDHFDRLVMSGQIEDMELKRVARARRDLSVWLHTGKKMKQLLGK